jgi:3-phenylpropionate/trans-cinnamate dioxygenase ferredoxin subunit
MTEWREVCAVGDIELEDVIRFKHDGNFYAVYRSPEDEYFATDGICTHQRIPLDGGLVIGDLIECPKHNGRFNYKTGQAVRDPACENLKTYPVRVEGGRILIEI